MRGETSYFLRVLQQHKVVGFAQEAGFSPSGDVVL